MKVAYIAGKFRGRTAWEIECNVRRAEGVALEVARLGIMPLCPHTNTRFFHGECDDEFWLEGTLELLRRCDCIVMVPVWRDSSGARKEYIEARRLRLRAFHSIAGLAVWLANPEDAGGRA